MLTESGVAVSDVKSIKAWVAPEDRVLTNVAVGVSLLAQDREELTCLWVGPYLTRFLRSPQKSMSICGKSGSGKTIVSSVLVDYLQRPIGGVNYKCIFVPINSRIPSETSARAIVKAILCQLFEKRIGNIQLLQILTDAHQRILNSTSQEDYDNILWNALERSLAAALPGARELVLVIDGIDEASCGETVLFKRLLRATTNGTNVRLITLGHETPAASPTHTTVKVTEELIFDDLMAVVRGHLDNCSAFTSMPEFDQESVAVRLGEAAKGSFLWAKLASKRLRHETKPDALHDGVDKLLESPPTMTDFVLHSLQSPGVTEDARLMLMWLATAERPLSLKELAALSAVQPDKNSIGDAKRVDVLHTLMPVNSLVFLQDGLLYLRHGQIRSAIWDVHVKGKLATNVKDPHADLATRLLAYIRLTVTDQHEPSLSPLDSHDTTQYIHRHPLLDFAIRHWPMHLTKTTVYTNEGEPATVKAFSKHFPTTITALLLQDRLWAPRPRPILMTYQSLVTNLYRRLFPQMNPMTLQTIVSLGIVCRHVNLLNDAITLFYEATTGSNTLFGPSHTITMQMSNIFIELTETRVTSTKTEMMTKREQILIILVECCKTQFGKNSTNVVAVLRQLVEHYRTTKEDQKIQQILTAIQSVTGTESSGETDNDGRLTATIRGRKENQTVEDQDVLHLDIVEYDERIDENYDFDLVIKRAEKYASEGKMEVAERTYIDLWQHVSRECLAHHTDLWAERNLKTVLVYSTFLQEQKRTSEASAILTSVWEEYSQTNTSITETSASLLTQVAKVMKTVGLSSVSLSVLKMCSQYYRSINRTETSTYKEIQQTMQSTSTEIMQSATQSSSFASETTIEEMVYESTSSSSMTQQAFSASSTLITQYISQRRWHDASRFIKRVLRSVWPSFFATSVQDVTFVQGDIEKNIQLAERLAECYHARRRQTKEEDVRVRIYRAVRSGRKVDDKLRERVTEDLLAYYRRHSQTDNVILIRQEMLDDYTDHYGPEHPKVIKTLWDLAELTRPRPVFVSYYQKIIRALNKDSEVTKPDAFKPVVIVATELWSKGQISDAIPYFRTLFVTFLKSPKVYPSFQDQAFVRELFERYMNCLRSVRTGFTVIHKTTTEYHAQCKTFFGATASITIQATLSLAKVCQESRTTEAQAITLYEELLAMKSDEIDRNEISSTLDMIYEEQATLVGSTSSSSVSAAQVDRAVTVLRKRVTTVREQHGWAHEESLSKLTEIVRLNSQRKETETVTRELKEATVQILSRETLSTRLMAAATTIASNYVSTNQVHKATELQQEIYRQIFMKDTSNTKTASFDLTARGRESIVFLAQLEYNLRRTSSTLTEILASLTTQYLYFEEFRQLIRNRSSTFYDVSMSTARLHRVLVNCKRDTAAAYVFTQYVNYFTNTEGKRVDLTQQSQVRLFLQSILDHFSTHTSRDVVRSVGILGNVQVEQLLEARRYDTACDLALACFKYISGHKVAYHTPMMAKLVLVLGMTIGGRDLATVPDGQARKLMLHTSGILVQDVLRVLRELRVNLSSLPLPDLNRLIGLVGEQQDYQTLAWILTTLWQNRASHRDWHPSVVFALARRFILARYAIGDSMAALRMAEHIVYNCRRVHGTRHPSTLDMSAFLAQLYTGTAQRYQAGRGGGAKGSPEMANRYYKKAAAIHENILRVYSDPGYAEMEGALLDGGHHAGAMGDGASQFDVGDLAVSEADDCSHTGGAAVADAGATVRQHLRLLKLAVERLGAWPKDFAEYERLNADVFREFQADLRGVEGVEKWNLKAFGAGKAEADDDLLDPNFKDWELIDTGRRHAVGNGNGNGAAKNGGAVEEEEL